MKEYAASEWRRLPSHATLTPEWIRPSNQAMFIKQLLLAFYPAGRSPELCHLEQFAASIHKEAADHSSALERAKMDQARQALEMALAGAGMDRGVFRKPKCIATRLAFKDSYAADFGNESACDACGDYGELHWNNRRGDWTVSCKNCGWKKVFRKAWIDRAYLENKRIAARENTFRRRFSSSEDPWYFYLPIEKLFVPEEGDSLTPVIVQTAGRKS